MLNLIVKITRTSDVLPAKLLDRDETWESWERIRWQEAGDWDPKSALCVFLDGRTPRKKVTQASF